MKERVRFLSLSFIVDKDARNTFHVLNATNLCMLLDWGGKTITRYESHHVQDKAHGTILKKLFHLNTQAA